MELSSLMGGGGGGGLKEFGSSQAYATINGDNIRGGGAGEYLPLILGGLFVVAFIVILQLAKK